MNLNNLSQWDRIVLWGCGSDARWYEGQFKLDYIVDKDEHKIGSKVYGVHVRTITDLITDSLSKKVLVIIGSSRYEREIKRDIEAIGINVEIAELSVMKAIYDCQNTCFALWGFDILIRDLLIRGGYDIRNMSYVEIGACHPILGSNTYNSYIAGARGVLVEPNPNLQGKLKKYRKDDICLLEGIADKKGKLIYYRFDNEFRNTFDAIEAEDAISKGFTSIGTLELEVESLENLINKSKIDTERTYLSIQAMGLEKNILKNFNYKKYKFPLIALAYYSDEILNYPIFDEYKLIAKVPRHIVLVNDEIYHKILGGEARCNEDLLL